MDAQSKMQDCYSMLAGDNNTGPVVYNASDGSLYYFTSYGQPSMSWSKIKDTPFEPLGLTGDYQNGLAIYNKQTVAYITDYSAAWKNFPNPPFNVLTMAGSPKIGVVVFGYNSDGNPTIAYMSSSDTTWNATYVPQGYNPELGQFKAITGDMVHGLVAYNPLHLSYTSKALEGDWDFVPQPPCQPELMAGDYSTGLFAYGNNKLYQLPGSSKDPKAWKEIPNLGFAIQQMVGHPDRGLVCVAGANNNVIASCSNLASGSWNILKVS